MDFIITWAAEHGPENKFFWEHMATPLVTLAVGIVGFLGIWLSLLYNAWKARKADELEQLRTAGALFADIQGNLNFAEKQAAMAHHMANITYSFTMIFPQIHPKQNVMEWLSPKLHILSPKCSAAIISAYTHFDLLPEQVAIHLPQTKDQQQIDRAQKALELIRAGSIIIVSQDDAAHLETAYEGLATSQDRALDMLVEQFPKLKEIRNPRMTKEQRLKYARENVTLTPPLIQPSVPT